MKYIRLVQTMIFYYPKKKGRYDDRRSGDRRHYGSGGVYSIISVFFKSNSTIFVSYILYSKMARNRFFEFPEKLLKPFQGKQVSNKQIYMHTHIHRSC